jgi:NADPH:quinone reductase-like Zn-dependent oxidoreductase
MRLRPLLRQVPLSPQLLYATGGTAVAGYTAAPTNWASAQLREDDHRRPLFGGKVAIVTGGASGLGRATVELFAEEGARIVVADVNDQRGAETCEAVEALGSKAVYIHTGW